MRVPAACCDDTAMLHLLLTTSSYAPGTHARSQLTQRAVYTVLGPTPRVSTIAALELAKELHELTADEVNAMPEADLPELVSNLKKLVFPTPFFAPNKDKHRRLLVVAKARTQDWDGMEAIAFETLKADRTDYLMYHLIAVAQEARQVPDQALTNYKRALMYQPDYQAAIDAASRLEAAGVTSRPDLGDPRGE